MAHKSAAVSHNTPEVVLCETAAFFWYLAVILLAGPVAAAGPIQWVDFQVSYEAMDRALALDIRSQEIDCPVSWIQLLALAACRTGGKVTKAAVDTAWQDFSTGKSPEELLGALYKYYDYYLEAYDAALGGLVGNFAILVEENGSRCGGPAMA